MAKTNSGLVEYCKAKVGCYYWYGTFGQMASKSLYNQKSSQYPTYYTAKDFAKQIANPKQVFDCAGLIKAYLWTDSIDDATSTYNAKQDFGATAFYNHCTKKGTIDSFDKVVGRLLFKGKSAKMTHVGVYIGDGKIAEAKGHAYGVVISDLDSKWTHWGQCNLITEDSATSEPAPQPAPAPAPTKSVDELAKEVIDGKWGNNPERKRALTEAGYDYDAVQKGVNEMLKKPTPGDNALNEYTRYMVDPAKVNSVLNVRATPNGRIVGNLPPYAEVNVVEEKDGWARIGTDRWVFKSYLKKT